MLPRSQKERAAYHPGPTGPGATPTLSRSPPEINLPITGIVLSTWSEQEMVDSGVYAALCHTRRQLYGPVGSSKSPTFDYLSIWARRKKSYR